MVALLLVLLEHTMIRRVKAVKMRVNYAQLVPTAQSVVETVLMCASSALLEHTVINLVSLDYDNAKYCS
jgi:hypothetical protein